MSINKLVYLDNNATTPTDERVVDAMLPFFTKFYANANSTHSFGVEVNKAVNKSREQVSEIIGSEPSEIIFTSGSTEAINIAIKGVAENYQSKGRHIITVLTEHQAVLNTCQYLEKKGFEVTYLPVLSDGLIDIAEIKKIIRKDTILVSVMYVNNETGVIQSIEEIAELTHSFGGVFMTDATQAVGKLPMNISKMNIDLLCMSGHKFYGPKGVGALFVKKRRNRIKLLPLIHGGGHESGLRSGTLNVPGIVGLGKACELAQNEMTTVQAAVKKLRDYLEAEILKIEGSAVNGNRVERIFNTTNICFPGIDSDAMIMKLSNPSSKLPAIAVSNGSACTSVSIEPSHVLTAMGLDQQSAFSSIRFSLNKYNIKTEMDVVADAVVAGFTELKAMS